jgi:hypothetical protein
VVIDGDDLRFWETSCQLGNPLPVREMEGAILFDAECASEGIAERRWLLLVPFAVGTLAWSNQAS